MLLAARVHRHREQWLASLVLATVACHDAADCVQPPCALPLAIELTATAAGSGTPVSGVAFTVGGAVSGQGPCSQGTCLIPGGPGTYDVDVSAPGYRTVHARVIVPGDTPACGCTTVVMQRVTVTLPVAL